MRSAGGWGTRPLVRPRDAAYTRDLNVDSALGRIRTCDTRFRNLTGGVSLSAPERKEAGQRTPHRQGVAFTAPCLFGEMGNWMGNRVDVREKSALESLPSRWVSRAWLFI